MREGRRTQLCNAAPVSCLRCPPTVISTREFDMYRRDCEQVLWDIHVTLLVTVTRNST